MEEDGKDLEKPEKEGALMTGHGLTDGSPEGQPSKDEALLFPNARHNEHQ